MAAAASGWKTRAACSFLQSLEHWALDGASHKKVSASTTRLSTSVRSWSLSLLCRKSDKLVSAWSAGHNGASANMPISTACLSLKSLSDLDETSPWADAASASEFPSRTQVMPFPVTKRSQLLVGWSMFTKCLVFLMGSTFFPQTHIFSWEGSHCVAQSVKHSGHWCVDRLRLSVLPQGITARPWTGAACHMWLLHDLIVDLLRLHCHIGLDHTSKAHGWDALRVAKLDKQVKDLLGAQLFHHLLDVLSHSLHGKGDLCQDKGI